MAVGFAEIAADASFSSRGFLSASILWAFQMGWLAEIAAEESL